MRLRRRVAVSVPVAAVLVTALIASSGGQAQAPSPPATASFTAIDKSWNVTGTSAHAATIATGGVVTFAYPTGTRHHNADFAAGPAPTSCTQTAGSSSGAVPPLPHDGTPAGWSGTCTFATPGHYMFACDVHPEMIATIDVVDPGTGSPPPDTTTTPGTPAPAPGGTTPPPAGPTPAPTVAGGSSPPSTPPGTAAGLSVARRQRGTRVRGTVTLATAARVAVAVRVGGRTAGKLASHRVAAGRHSFAVTLDQAARRTLRRRGGLTLTVVVTVDAKRSSRTVTLRG